MRSVEAAAGYAPGSKAIEQRIAELQRELGELRADNLTYAVIKAKGYRQGLVKLRSAHKKGEAPFQPRYGGASGMSTVRPLTFQETIDAKVNAYESGNKKLFHTALATSTGIVYDGKGKFKVVQLADALMSLPNGFDQGLAQASYEGCSAPELDEQKAKYNNLIHGSEVLVHPAWNEAVPDRALLKAYTEIVFSELNAVHTEKAMGFWLRPQAPKDALGALAIDLLLGCYSVANGVDDLNSEAHFLCVRGKATGA